ncbi:MAG: TasA family protein [Oscillospiraceae bacterium]
MSLINKLKQTGKLKMYALIISAILIVTVAIGGTMAWLSDSQTINNSFSVSKVKCEVRQDVSGTSRENVVVENTGEIDGFVRAVIVLSWVDSEGNTVPQQVKDSDFTMDLNSAEWFKASDGFYYYRSKLVPQGKTHNLINSFTVNDTSGTSTLKLEVVAASIQANPKTAVEEAWSAVLVDASGNLINK